MKLYSDGEMPGEEDTAVEENLERFSIPDHIDISQFKKQFEARIPTDWQEVLGLISMPRMLLPPEIDEKEMVRKMSPKEQRSYWLLRNIARSMFVQLGEEAYQFFALQAGKAASPDIDRLLESAPSEFKFMAHTFPNTMVNLYDHLKTWDIFVLCKQCKEYVALSSLEIHALDAETRESVAVHCRPDFELSLRVDLKLAIRGVTPKSVVEAYRRVAIMHTGLKEGIQAETLHGQQFHEKIQENRKENLSAVSTLLENGLLMFHEIEVPASLSKHAQYFPIALKALYSQGNTWDIEVRCEHCGKHVALSELKIFEKSSDHEAMALHCRPKMRQAKNNLIDYYNLFDTYAILKNYNQQGGKSENIYDSPLKDPSSRSNSRENAAVIAELIQKNALVYKRSETVKV